MSKPVKFKGMYVFLPEETWKDFDIICTQEDCKKSWMMTKLIHSYVQNRKDIIEEWKKQHEHEPGEEIVEVVEEGA